MANLCPVCGAIAYVRTSRRLGRETREVYYNCSNIECCGQFKMMEGDPVFLAIPVNMHKIEYRVRLSPRKFGPQLEPDKSQLELNLNPRP